MKMICKASTSDWFTAGRVYPAAMKNETFVIAAILADDMVSDLTENGGEWMIPIHSYSSTDFHIHSVASFKPWLIPIRFKGSNEIIEYRLHDAAQSGRLFMRKGGNNIPIRFLAGKFLNDLGREMTISEMIWHNYKGRLAWWG